MSFVLSESQPMTVTILIYDGFACSSAGEYIASGSDDGRWFIWEKLTGRLIKMLHGDEAGNVFFLTKWFQTLS